MYGHIRQDYSKGNGRVIAINSQRQQVTERSITNFVRVCNQLLNSKANALSATGIGGILSATWMPDQRIFDMLVGIVILKSLF